MSLMREKVALVTGAGAGIGRATALRFAQEGARVVVSDVDSEAGHETVRIIRETGADANFARADVSNAADVQAMIDHVIGSYGRLDCACNNAGIEGAVLPLTDQSEENFDRIIAVNLRGVFLCLKAEISAMLKTGGGSIVNLSSVAGLIGFPGLSPYVASKHGVNGLTKNAALEYAKQGIRVNSICPGGIDTRMLDSLAAQATGGKASTSEMMAPLHPLGRIGTADEVANLIVWLCSPQAAFVTGAHVPVDGGYVAQ
ncbi:NAD(P)-dependent dehydrogenase, short-chain alcohol dehydrogenase family [Devosia enhydra]|uniref:NAD(P)-dependent dehydrogenase, short-chain alcohol dehydrogenase family n=1 Tax=Devosia enhydra TaxID=665118 RepID=A0A1K2HXQ5_9HYPH|nr:SDR family oxidoreductase [Devosia enhydra]SFZ84539.1 NAD(P)-dependent dehydrogenase, short-chain alcohol dehydrogenase family [Devosia enhydra]